MGQVNLSLTDDTKKCLAALQQQYHCTSLSETVSRLIWDAKQEADAADASHRSEMVFDVFRIMAVMDEMKKAFRTAFSNDYLYSVHEFERMVERDMITEHADMHAFIYGTPAGSNLHNVILRFSHYPRSSPSELVRAIGAKWIGSLEVEYWRVDTQFGFAPDDIVIQPVLANTKYNKLMESMPEETGLSFMKPIGFQIVHKTMGCIRAIWDPDTRDFNIF